MLSGFEKEMLDIAKRHERDEKQKKIIAGVIFIPFLLFGLWIFMGVMSTM